MRKTALLCLLLLSVCPVTGGTVVQAAISYFTISATGTQETPANASGAVGGGIAAFDDVANTININLFFAGLTSPATASHIHDGAPGVPGPVIVSFVPFTPAATAGSIVGGPLAFPVANIPDLLAGKTYFNIHDSVYPGGEIRGQLVPTPEPASIGLLALGTLAHSIEAASEAITITVCNVSVQFSAGSAHRCSARRGTRCSSGLGGTVAPPSPSAPGSCICSSQLTTDYGPLTTTRRSASTSNPL